jgi:predicted kinase
MSKLILIMGGPASGKSTIAAQLAKTFPKSVHLQVDKLREMMVNGIELPVAGHEWSDKTTQQFKWARDTAIYMAQLYAAQGFAVIVDDVCVPAEFTEHYQQFFAAHTVQRILLLPTASALIKRLQTRAGPFDDFLITKVPWLYSNLEPMPKEGWQVLDSSDWSIDETMNNVVQCLA